VRSITEKIRAENSRTKKGSIWARAVDRDKRKMDVWDGTCFSSWVLIVGAQLKGAEAEEVEEAVMWRQIWSVSLKPLSFPRCDRCIFGVDLFQV
jgi:hypothetical protein